MIQSMHADLDPEPFDQADSLAPFVDRFWRAPDVIAYLDGNSLGRLPHSTRDVLQATVDEGWGQRLIRGWTEGWVEMPVRAGDELAAATLGSAAGQTVIADSTSVNIYKVLRAAIALRPQRDEIVVDDTAFPTDRYLAEAVAGECGMKLRLVHADPVYGVNAEALAGVLGPATAVALLSHVDYRSGALMDMAGLTQRLHEAGAIAIWDLSHSAGVVPISLDAGDVDFAVGCTYKYLNGGPGAPAFIYVAQRHLEAVHQPIPGWWSAENMFAMEQTHRPAGDIRRMLSGTPGILALSAVRSGVALTAEAGIGAIRAKSVELGTYLVRLLQHQLPDVEIASPPASERGSHVTISVQNAASVTEKLIARGVIPDLRHPDLIRLGLSPLSTSFAEVAAAVDILVEVID